MKTKKKKEKKKRKKEKKLHWLGHEPMLSTLTLRKEY